MPQKPTAKVHAGPKNPPYPEAPYRPIGKLAAVTCHFNPAGYRRIEQNYHRFRAALPPELPLYTIELAFDEDPFRLKTNRANAARMIQIRGRRDRHNLWQKERLINLAIRQLPADVDAVAWLDADLLWMNPFWLDQAIDLLKRYSAVQLFGGVADADAEGRIVRNLPGYVHARSSTDPKAYGRPGGAWAARREILMHRGIYDRHIIGGGDSGLLYCWEEETGPYPPSLSFGPAWRDHFEAWCRKSRIGRSMAFVPGDVVHLYHGQHARRNYVARYEILHDNEYDPATDVEVDPGTGLLQWSDSTLRSKQDMVRRVAEYFYSRREDD